MMTQYSHFPASDNVQAAVQQFAAFSANLLKLAVKPDNMPQIAAVAIEALNELSC